MSGGQTQKKNVKDHYQYLSHLKSLNLQLISHIEKHLSSNDNIDLSVVFKDYDNYLEEINLKYGDGDKDEGGSKKEEKEKKQESEENPMMNDIYANDEENVQQQSGSEEKEVGVVIQESTKEGEEPEERTNISNTSDRKFINSSFLFIFLIK